MRRRRTVRWPGAGRVLGLLLLAALELALAVRLGTGGGLVPLALALAPALLLCLAALVASDRAALFAAALALNLIAPPFVRPLPIGIGGNVYVSDLIVVLAAAAWTVRRAVLHRNRPTPPGSVVLRWPLILFGAAVLSAGVRGHFEYGANIVGEPLRLVAYAAIAFALTDLGVERAYRIVVAVVYTTAVWMILYAGYDLALGRSQTDQWNLSTGGTRTVSLSVAMYLASALVLALLNLALDERPARRALHVSIAAISTAGVILAFGRATFLGAALAVLVVFVAYPRVRGALLVLAPLCLPFVAIGALLVPRVLPDVGPTLVSRVASPVGQDANYKWREAATAAVLDQAEGKALLGTGFGLNATFTFGDRRETIAQDPHNSYIYLYAGGGLAALGSFLLVCGVAVVDGVRRLRTAGPRGRALVVWSLLTLLVFLVNLYFGPVLASPPMLLTVWLTMLLPSIVPTEAARPAVTRPALSRAHAVG